MILYNLSFPQRDEKVTIRITPLKSRQQAIVNGAILQKKPISQLRKEQGIKGVNPFHLPFLQEICLIEDES